MISVGTSVFSTIVLALLPNIPMIPDVPMVPITSISTALSLIYFATTPLTVPTSQLDVTGTLLYLSRDVNVAAQLVSACRLLL